MVLQSLSIPSSAFEYLRNQIITGQLAPGQKLNEEQVAAELSISRPPLREAFRLLESELLVMRIPRRGTYVSDISVEDLDDLYQVREMIEGRAMDLLKSKGIRELPEAEEILKSAEPFTELNSGDLAAVLRQASRSSNFHFKIIESARSLRLTYFYESIASNIKRYKVLLHVLNTRYNSQDDHLHLIELIKKGSYDEAKEFMINHMKKSYAFLRNEMVNNKNNP
jgi:DNA-binding GntR family transcriptional regulator